ncbi:TIM barrel protein [Streptacidiphilus griseoplanus]|uniref:TIM barrel protein n=1 Tax=Peterkaempfera griseoplana TaxID=66896 RepID=UPI0006E19EBB|nr:TIM barrel protein [Peterkaempfera griseoplana]
MTTVSVPPMLSRVAAAPISWGVCEVPGWGHQLPPGRVLAEMRQLGLTATEFGPEGFLPEGPAARAAELAAHGLTAVGGFVPLVLHRPDHDPVPAVRSALDALAACGARTLVLAAATGLDGYDTRPDPGAEGWRLLLGRLDTIAELAAGYGVAAALHPHIGTLVERAEEVRRVLDGSSAPLCLDTGHLLVGGTDPVELARRAPDRIAHVHLKDVDAAAAREVREGRVPYARAVAAGLYRPLGQGDVDIAALVATLEGHGYRGWYVMEQDAVLTAEPGPGAGPLRDVADSLDFLRTVAG